MHGTMNVKFKSRRAYFERLWFHDTRDIELTTVRYLEMHKDSVYNKVGLNKHAVCLLSLTKTNWNLYDIFKCCTTRIKKRWKQTVNESHQKNHRLQKMMLNISLIFNATWIVIFFISICKQQWDVDFKPALMTSRSLQNLILNSTAFLLIRFH